MAITIEASPQVRNAAYNENYFLINSTESGEIGFRYIVRVFNGTELLGRYKIRPRPNDGKGEFDIKTLLQQQLGEDYDPTLLNYDLLNNQSLSYNLEIDEEYISVEPFLGYGFTGAINWPNFSDPTINPSGSSRTSLLHVSEPVYEQGDVVNVVQDNTPNFVPQLEGVHTVLDKFLLGSFWYLVLDLPWVAVSGVSPGDVFSASGQKTVFSGITSDSYEVFRGAYSQSDFVNYNHLTWQTQDNKRKFLTTLPDAVRISRNKSTYFALRKQNTDNMYALFIIDNAVYRYVIGSGNEFIQFNALPSDDNIEQVLVSGNTWATFTGGLDLTNITSYTLQIRDFNLTSMTRQRTINLYSECDEFETYDITFLDRLGSWITIPFYKGDYLNQTVNKKKFRKKYGQFGSSEWEYSLLDRGVNTYDSEEEITYTVNTGILSETESQYMKELVSSPSVYVSINGGDSTAIDIVTSSLPLHKHRTKRDRKASIKFVKSVQDNING